MTTAMPTLPAAARPDGTATHPLPPCSASPTTRSILASPHIILAAPPAILPALCNLLSINPDNLVADDDLPARPAPTDTTTA
jgi:hypothetical protein